MLRLRQDLLQLLSITYLIFRSRSDVRLIGCLIHTILQGHQACLHRGGWLCIAYCC